MEGKSRKNLFSLFIILCLVLFGVAWAQEKLTISTYYPAPYGVYKKLRLVPVAVTTDTDCSGSGEGAMQYSNSEHQPLVCTLVGGSLKWRPMAGAAVPPGTWCGYCDNPSSGIKRQCQEADICTNPCPTGWDKVQYTIPPTTYTVCIKKESPY